MSWIVVRVRSDVKVERSIRETMHHLNLTRVNHAVIIPKNDQYRGMLQKAKDYITWGEADLDTVDAMLRHRGRLVGGAPLTDEAVAEGGDQFFPRLYGLSRRYSRSWPCCCMTAFSPKRTFTLGSERSLLQTQSSKVESPRAAVQY